MPELKTQDQLDDLLNDPDALQAHIKVKVAEEFGVREATLAEQREANERERQELGLYRAELENRSKRPPMVEGKAKDEPGPSGWSGAGEYLQAVTKAGAKGGQVDTRLKILGEGSGDAGGFLVPDEYRAELLSLPIEGSIVRPRATVIPIGRSTVRIPAILDTTHATNVFGGVQGYWTPELGSITASEPTFSQVVLEAKKLVFNTRIGNELLEDSAVSLPALISNMFGRAAAWFEDDAFIAGTGAGQPTGIKNAAALVSQAKETGQAANTIVWQNIINMYSRMLPSSLGTAVWVAHPNTFPQLATMALSVGTGGSAVWLNNGVAGPPLSILGRPVLFSEKCETVGTAGDIYFVDFSYYLIGDRQTMTLAVSEHSAFRTDETEFRGITRLDGRPWISSALTPRNGTTTISPIVGLAVRA